jgi:hypothetical protein
VVKLLLCDLIRILLPWLETGRFIHHLLQLFPGRRLPDTLRHVDEVVKRQRACDAKDLGFRVF